MSDLQSNEDTAQPDTARRRAITYLALGAGLAAVGFLAPQSAQAYYGRCYKCSCCNFEGTQTECSNCGHSYDNHSGQQCAKNREP